jgi:hypothetical protein
MRTRIAAAVLSSLLALPVLAQTASAPAAAQADMSRTGMSQPRIPQVGAPAADGTPGELQALEAAPAQVVVSGRRPGPGVWKVSKGNHVM